MDPKEATEKLKILLKDRTILLANWGCGDKDTFQCRDWIPIFKKIFKKTATMSFRNHFYFYGKKTLNNNFLKLLEKEKPDYLIFGHRYDEITFETIKKIKQVSPNTKTIIEYGDDDFRFDDWGRYYSLFFDYIWTSKKELSIYENDNINTAYFMIGISTAYYRPLNLPKLYDVSFIGRPVADRYDYIKFLLKNNVNLTLFGPGWDIYPDLKHIYKGVPHDDDFIKAMIQSKINLNFSKTLFKEGTKGQIKGRIMEVPACKTFLLNEFTEMNPHYINKRKEINFKTRKELLEKIDYYLKNETARENLANLTYKDVLNEFSWEWSFLKFFEDTEKHQVKNLKLPNPKLNSITITNKDLKNTKEQLISKLKNIDYILLTDNKAKISKYREYFHTYSLYISKKQISCCDYIVYSNKIGDYLLFKSKNAFNILEKNAFNNLININQLATTKNFLIENLDEFRKLFDKKYSNIINNNNTVFISIPLIKTNKFPNLNYNTTTQIFHQVFFDKIIPLIYQKNFLNIYMFKFLNFSLNGNFFMMKHVFNRLFNMYNFKLIKSFQTVKQ